MDRDLSSIAEWGFLLLTAAGALALTWLVVSLIVPSTRRLIRLRFVVGLVLVVQVLWCAAFPFVRRYTGLGIIILGGSDYWIDLAAHAQSEEQARAYVAALVNSSQYGVSVAQRSIERLPDARIRARMWQLLADESFTDSDRSRFLSKAQHEEESHNEAGRLTTR